MSPTADLLVGEVRRQGPIRFDRFMELALYCPESGYYEQFLHTPGQRGDYFTSVSVGPLFGELLAQQVVRWLDESGVVLGGKWHWVEGGAHDGRLTGDLLDALEQLRPDRLEGLCGILIEPSARRREWQRQTLGARARWFRWVTDWDGIPERAVRGVIFSNELLDAMPVRRLGWSGREQAWFEWGVDWDGAQFRHCPLAGDVVLSREVEAWLAALTREYAEGWTDGLVIEVSEAALTWWRRAAAALGAGHLATVDYGLETEQWGGGSRKEGTLRAYSHHQLQGGVLERPGEQDLTAHVNWSLVRAVGESEGLTTWGLMTQERWLGGIAAKELALHGRTADWTPSRVRQFQTLTHPGYLGASFQVLIQTRAVAAAASAGSGSSGQVEG